MNERARRQVTDLEAALQEARALAESRRLELVKMSAQLDELLHLAASQNEQLSDLRQMFRADPMRYLIKLSSSSKRESYER